MQIGDTARDFQYQVHGARRQCETLNGSFQQSLPVTGQVAVTIDSFQRQLRVQATSLPLQSACTFNPTAYRGAVLARLCLQLAPGNARVRVQAARAGRR